jgi:hypothetical protein
MKERAAAGAGAATEEVGPLSRGDARRAAEILLDCALERLRRGDLQGSITRCVWAIEAMATRTSRGGDDEV